MPPLTGNQRMERWFTCARCGFDYPMSQAVRQDGMLVCRQHCVLEQGAEYYRSKMVPPEKEGYAQELDDSGEVLV